MSTDNMLVIIPARGNTAALYDVDFSALSSHPAWSDWCETGNENSRNMLCRYVYRNSKDLESRGFCGGLIGTFADEKSAYGEYLRLRNRGNFIVEYGVTSLIPNSCLNLWKVLSHVKK